MVRLCPLALGPVDRRVPELEHKAPLVQRKMSVAILDSGIPRLAQKALTDPISASSSSNYGLNVTDALSTH